MAVDLETPQLRSHSADTDLSPEVSAGIFAGDKSNNAEIIHLTNLS
jgi:hypothetical protein